MFINCINLIETMEHQKILNLLNEASDSKFVASKWDIFNDQSNRDHDVGNEIINNADVLKTNLCDHSDAYILVRGDITLAGRNLATEVAFQICASFTKCITKIDGTTKDDAEDLDLVMLMYNLLEYSSNYSDTIGVYKFILKVGKLILMLILRITIISNLSSVRLNYQETPKLKELMEL